MLSQINPYYFIMKRFTTTIVSLMLIITAQAQIPQALKIKVNKLKNGMEVWVNEDHSQPRVLGVVIVKAGEEWTVTKDIIQSKCKWSPMEGHKYSWQVVDTFVNGQLVYDNGTFNADYRGEQISFRD